MITVGVSVNGVDMDEFYYCRKFLRLPFPLRTGDKVTLVVKTKDKTEIHESTMRRRIAANELWNAGEKFGP